MPDSADWWARGVAIAALAVSFGALAWNIAWNVSRDRRARGRIEVTATAPPRDPDEGVHADTGVISLRIRNAGGAPVFLEAIRIECGDGWYTSWLRQGSGVKLEPGESHKWFMTAEHFERNRNPETGKGPTDLAVIDASGHEHRVPGAAAILHAWES